MIFPTLIIGIIVTYYHRKNITDLIHNTSVVFWIAANSSWMISEFLGVDHNFYGTGIPGKWIAAAFFIMGIALLVGYYSYRLYKMASVKKPTAAIKETGKVNAAVEESSSELVEIN